MTPSLMEEAPCLILHEYSCLKTGCGLRLIFLACCGHSSKPTAPRPDSGCSSPAVVHDSFIRDSRPHYHADKPSCQSVHPSPRSLCQAPLATVAPGDSAQLPLKYCSTSGLCSGNPKEGQGFDSSQGILPLGSGLSLHS